MGRKGIKIITLHGCSMEELREMENSLENEFERNMITAVIMRYEGVSTIKIAELLLKSKQTVISYIKRWNAEGLKVLGEIHGGRKRTFTSEMLDDLINTVLNLHPSDLGYKKNMWTYKLLSEYIYKNYGEKYSIEYIRVLLKRNNLNYK
ncbi:MULTISPECIES: helix-turn-helix domain-containing protein [unclassified Clostridium]|uniref:helix-turn-helix domain-containing protein n=1 Tax=unclassified Clostridium TaxID=2614128 RepID=UPI000297C062|nr:MULTISPECIES: helix-turn-helix domain-containing protein [unclassified Clostridium]EKQ53056.1 MAG: transposase [Clostridium sp. Maddingley MBC34-26]